MSDIREKDKQVGTAEEEGDFQEKALKEIPRNIYGQIDRLVSTRSLVIRKAELMARQYERWYLQLLFLCCAFICTYGYSLGSTVRSSYMTFATNSYKTHSLLSTISIINLVISAVSQLFFAGLSDVFGRISLLIIATIFYIVGTVMQSQAYDIQRYAAGSVFYNVGVVGVMLQVTLFLSDNSSLKWRLLYAFVPAWPSIINVWVSGNIVDMNNPLLNWSWGIGMWAFIGPLTTLPLFCCLLHMRYLASKTEEWQQLLKEKTFYEKNGLVQTLVQLFWKLDIIGLMLFVVSTGCILVPLTIAGGVSNKWKTVKIILPLVLGFALLPGMIYWESKCARNPFAPFKLIKDRGIWAPIAMNFMVCFVYQMACGYLYTLLIVAMNQSYMAATRISTLYAFSAGLFSPFFGFLVAKSRRLKFYMVIGCGMYFIIMGLFYHFRGGDNAAKGIIGAMTIWGIATCMYNYPITTAAQSVTSHEHMATVTAFLLTVYRIGGAVASAISGAIWTNSLYPKLLDNMGDEELASVAYQSPLTFITLHKWGTPTRQAMVEAYRAVQRYEVIVALAIVAPMFIVTLCLRDPELVDDYGQKLEDGEFVNKHSDDKISEWLLDKLRWFRNKE